MSKVCLECNGIGEAPEDSICHCCKGLGEVCKCTVLDSQSANANRDVALEQVESNANSEWTQLTLQIIKNLAESEYEFTSDNVWLKLADYPNITTHQPSAMGAMFKRAVRLNYIQSTDRFIQSQRPSSHARPIRVWQSKLKEKNGMDITTTSQAW